MAFDNPIPWWALLLLIAAAALVTYRAYARPVAPLTNSRRALLASIRVLTLLLLITLLLQPVAIEPSPERRDALVPVLVDTSRSMRLRDVGGRRRIDRAVELVRDEVLPSVGAAFDVEVLTFGETLAPADLSRMTADGWRSDLAGALSALTDRYRGRSVAGVIIVSDGGDTSGREPALVAADGDVPVYVVGVGAPEIARDREVIGLTVGEAPLPESVVDLSASVVSHGFGAEPIEIRLLEDGRVLQVSRVAPSESGSPVREVFRVSPKPDVATLYTVDVPADPGELTAENNARRVLVQPAGRARRVLFAEGAPGYEHAFLSRAWSRDPGLELDSVVRKGQNERGDSTFYIQGHTDRTAALAEGYPLTRQALFFYDTVVLSNMEAAFFSQDQLAMTADFVSQRGGGLVVLGARTFTGRGLAATPLEAVLPLELSGRVSRVSATTQEPNRVSITPDGEHHRIMRLGESIAATRARWAAAPPLAAVAALGGPKPGASVLALTLGAAGGVHPLVAVQPHGRGRVMVFTGEASWRWKMLLPSDDRTFETFWRQAVRWLATPAPDPVTVATTGGAIAGDEVTLDVTSRDARYDPVSDASITVQMTDPDGTVTELRPTLVDGRAGRYVARFTPAQPGVYHIDVDARQGMASLGTAEEWFLVGGSDLELADPRMNAEVLRRIAAASGGELLSAQAVGDLPTLLRSRATDPARHP